MIGSWEVQVALKAALAGIAGGRVYDAAGTPANVGFPYVQIGESQVLNDDLSGRDGADEYRTLHIWSRYGGQMELFHIAAEIETALQDRDLGGTRPETAHVYIRDFRTMRDPDGKTQHGVMTVRIQHFQPSEA